MSEVTTPDKAFGQLTSAADDLYAIASRVKSEQGAMLVGIGNALNGLAVVVRMLEQHHERTEGVRTVCEAMVEVAEKRSHDERLDWGAALATAILAKLEPGDGE